MDVEFLNKNFRVRAYCKDNIIYINAEDTAREFGFIKNNRIDINKLNRYAIEFGYPKVEEYIEETLFLMLGMRAEKKEAKDFQLWVATEIMPALRKGDNEELQKLSMTFIETTEKAKQQFKPTHKTKLYYNKLIKQLTNSKKEQEIVKSWVFATLNARKWEDISINDHDKVIDIIKSVAALLTTKEEQITFLKEK